MLRLGRHEFGAILSVFVLASGLWVFIEVADEVTEGETRALDRALLLALRNPSNLADPRGPPWLEEMGRDLTALGGTSALVRDDQPLSERPLAVLGALLARLERNLLLKAHVLGWALFFTVLVVSRLRTRAICSDFDIGRRPRPASTRRCLRPITPLRRRLRSD